MKKLACTLGRHDWTTHVEEGESYKVCAACGKSPKGSRRSGPDYPQRGFIGEGAEKPRDDGLGRDIGTGGGFGP